MIRRREPGLRCHPCHGTGEVQRACTIWLRIGEHREPRTLPLKGTMPCPTCKGTGRR